MVWLLAKRWSWVQLDGVRMIHHVSSRAVSRCTAPWDIKHPLNDGLKCSRLCKSLCPSFRVYFYCRKWKKKKSDKVNTFLFLFFFLPKNSKAKASMYTHILPLMMNQSQGKSCQPWKQEVMWERQGYCLGMYCIKPGPHPTHQNIISSL